MELTRQGAISHSAASSASPAALSSWGARRSCCRGPALAAIHPAFEPRHLGLSRVARHVDQRRGDGRHR